MIRKGIIQIVGLALMAVFSTSCNLFLTQEERKAAKVNEEHTFDVRGLASTLHLAIEIEVTADDVKPIAAKIIRGPLKSSAGLADLRIQALEGDKVVREYVIPDPRIAEVERGGVMMLPRARTFIYTPLSAALTRVRVVPVAGREKIVSKGGVMDARALAQQACRQQPDLKECKEIL